jgi:hypothetical protein
MKFGGFLNFIENFNLVFPLQIHLALLLAQSTVRRATFSVRDGFVFRSLLRGDLFVDKKSCYAPTNQ